MFNIEETKNFELIDELLFDEEIYNALISDNSWKRGMKITQFENLRFFVFFYGKIPIGICVFVIINDYISIVHIGILKEYRGKEIYKLAKEMLKMYFGMTNCEKIVCRIRKYNKKSIFFAIYNGFKILGQYGMYKYLEVTRNGRFT